MATNRQRNPSNYLEEWEYDYLYPENGSQASDDIWSPYYNPETTDAGTQASDDIWSPYYNPETTDAGTQAESPYYGNQAWNQSALESNISYADYGTAVEEEQKKPNYSIKIPETTTISGSQTSTTTTTPIKPTTPAPTFTLPEWDESQIRSLRRKYMAPTRSLNESLRRTLASLPSADNPYVAKEMGRGAVEGYGTGISQISTSAGMQGMNEYLRKRAEEIAALQTQYQGQLAGWLKEWGQETVSKTGRKQTTEYEYL